MTTDKKLIVFGAGGHGKVVADIALRAGLAVSGFVDDHAIPGASVGLPWPVLGDREWLCAQPRSVYQVALGIGDNYVRLSVANFLHSKKIDVSTIISPFAIVSPFVQVGTGTVIMSGAVVNAMANIGEGVIVNTGAVVEHDVKVGNYSHLSPNSTLGGGAKVGEFAHIALGAIVLPLLSIGSRSVLGAGSVATRSIPANVIAFGVPARIQPTSCGGQEVVPIQAGAGSG